jgi:hypothetical protein
VFHGTGVTPGTMWNTSVKKFNAELNSQSMLALPPTFRNSSPAIYYARLLHTYGMLNALGLIYYQYLAPMAQYS